MLATLTIPTTAAVQALAESRSVLIRSAEELRDTLRAAGERALALDLSALDRMLRLDRRRRQLELQAATPWAALAAYLSEHYSAAHVAILRESFDGSIGEAVSRNDAGPDGVPLSVHVEAITLVTADGELRRADRQTNTALFRLALGGHGLVGVLYSVTLRIDSLLQAAACAEAPVSIDLGEPPASIQPRRTGFLVPPAQLDCVLDEVKAIAREQRVELHRVTVRKLLPESETVLRRARREWASVELHYSVRATLGAAVHANEIERQFFECALRHAGSFSLGTGHLPTLAQFEACYPALGEFLAAKRRLDPQDRLQVAWYRRLAAMLRSEWPAAQASAGVE